MLLLVINGAFMIHAITSIAHMPVACALVWGIYFLMRWSDTQSLRDVLLAGLILGTIPTFRYPDAVVALGAGIFMLWQFRRTPQFFKHIAFAAAGAMVPIGALLLRNQLTFGAFWKTGYALTNEQTGFGLNYFLQHFVGYMQLLAGSGTGVLLGLGAIGCVWMCADKSTRPLGVMLGVIVISIVGLYMSYYWAAGIGGGRGGNAPPRGPVGVVGGAGGGAAVGAGGAGAGAMRFYVPIVPLLAILACGALARMTRDLPRFVTLATVVVLVFIQASAYGPQLAGELRQLVSQTTPLAAATRELETVASPGDVVIANPRVLQHLDFVRDWKLADPTNIRGNTRAGGAGGGGAGGGGGGGRSSTGAAEDNADAPSPQQRAKAEWLASKFTGSTKARTDKFAADLTKWADGKTIWLLASQSEYEALAKSVGATKWTIERQFALPRVGKPRNSLPQSGPPQAGGDGAGGGGVGGGGGGGRPTGRGLNPDEDVVIAKLTFTPQ